MHRANNGEQGCWPEAAFSLACVGGIAVFEREN